MRKLALQNLLNRFALSPRPAFSQGDAGTYYLPEGRFYAAPLALKRQPRRGKALPLALGLCFAVSSAAFIQRPPLAALPANMTIFSALPAAAQRDFSAAQFPAADDSSSGRPALDPIQTASIGDAGRLIARAAASAREDKINRAGKGGLLLSLARNARPHLINYDLHYAALARNSAAQNFAASLKNQLKETYAARFMPLQPADKKQLAWGLAPAQRRPARPVLPVPHLLAALVNNDKPDVLALGYASVPANPARESPFDSLLAEKTDKNAGRFIPPIGKKDHAWAATPLPASVFQPKEQKCLAEAVYFEARGESLKGQAAVAQVVLNRVRNPAYPDSVCKVVYQNVNWYNHCQFSFACDGKKHRVTELRPWRVAEAVAKAVSAGQIWLPDIGSSTHYHAVYVHPQWAALMDKMEKIGSHIFYRTKNGGWS